MTITAKLAELRKLAVRRTVLRGDSGRYPNGEGWGHAWNEEVVEINAAKFHAMLDTLTEYEAAKGALVGECCGYCCPACGRCYTCHDQALTCLSRRAATLRQQGGRVDEAAVAKTTCNCHSETCCCGDYTLTLNGTPVANGNRAQMQQIADAINTRPAALAQRADGEAVRYECRRRNRITDDPGPWMGCDANTESDLCRSPTSDEWEYRKLYLHPERASVSDGLRERIKLAIKHGDEHGWATARNELLGILGSYYFAAPQPGQQP